MAKLYFRYGSMNSGKTALLLQAVHNYEEQGMKVFVAKPKKDTKGDEYLVSRIGLKRKIDYAFSSTDNIYKHIEKQAIKISCLFIDEAQFLEPIQADELLQVVIKLDIPVICYGLRTDFQGKGFPGSTRLLEIAHTIEEMKTICNCGRKATFNSRKENGHFTITGEQIAIDGENKITYEPLCAHCYYEKLEKYNYLNQKKTRNKQRKASK